MAGKTKLSAVITGASSGIGKALALRLADKHGAQIVINGRNEEQLADTKEKIEELGGQCVAVVEDIGEKGVAAGLVDTCVERFGQIKLLVNNAGMAHPGLVQDLTTETWERVFAVNFFACLEAIYAALPHFKELGHGKIVNVSSVAGKVSLAGSVCYASSKHALNAMSTGMAAELTRKKIDVITVCPGWVRTEFFEKNNVDDERNPTLIARSKGANGWLMRKFLSISAEEVAERIDHALIKGGSHELIMTAPGKLVERTHGIFPGLVSTINNRIPLKYVNTSARGSDQNAPAQTES